MSATLDAQQFLAPGRLPSLARLRPSLPVLLSIAAHSGIVALLVFAGAGLTPPKPDHVAVEMVFDPGTQALNDGETTAAE